MSKQSAGEQLPKGNLTRLECTSHHHTDDKEPVSPPPITSEGSYQALVLSSGQARPQASLGETVGYQG